jgi:hypothetical protein
MPNNVVQWRYGLPVIRNQKEMTSGSVKEVFDQVFRFVRSAIWAKRHKRVGGARQRQRDIGNIALADPIEPAQIGWLLQLRQALKHRGFELH